MKIERQQLLTEQRQLNEALTPLHSGIDTDTFRKQLISFSDVIEEARPEEMQRIMRLMVKQIELMPEGANRVQFYLWPQADMTGNQTSKKAKTNPEAEQDWFATNVLNGCPQRRNLKPLILRAIYSIDNAIREEFTRVFAARQQNFDVSAT